MGIIQSIAEWAAQQPAWIDDAIRRLMVGGLKPQDYQELSALAKAEQGLPDPNGQAAVRLDSKTLPAAAQDGLDVSLEALRSPQNLNAIDPNQALTFQAAGLTIVYGHNGAGKSGYARVLKKACRARNVEDILPDVYVESKGSVPASAAFDWREGQAAKSQRWTVGTVPPEPLSRMSVFDAHCARVFVDGQAEILFVPDGMEVIHGLSDTLGAVQTLIEADRRRDAFNHAQLSSLAGDTVVGRSLAKLGRKSDPEAFKKLAALSEEEEVERQVLTTLFKDEDPAKLAAAIRRVATRLGTLRNELGAIEAP